MRRDEYPCFVNIMKRAAVLTYRPKNTDFNDLLWVLFEELAPRYSLLQIDLAVRLHTQREKFFPLLSDIIRCIEGTAEDRAIVAWGIVMKAVRYVGSRNSVAFPSPEYNYAITQMGGWIKFSSTLLEEEVKWRGKEFERYFVLGDQRVSWYHEPGKVRVERYCIGTHEINSRRNGYALPEVKNAETGEPIPEFRKALPAPENKVASMINALAEEKRVLPALNAAVTENTAHEREPTTPKALTCPSWEQPVNALSEAHR